MGRVLLTMTLEACETVSIVRRINQVSTSVLDSFNNVIKSIDKLEDICEILVDPRVNEAYCLCSATGTTELKKNWSQ